MVCSGPRGPTRYNRQDWNEALAHYQQLEKVAVLKRHVLEARIGIMRCSRELEDGETVGLRRAHPGRSRDPRRHPPCRPVQPGPAPSEPRSCGRQGRPRMAGEDGVHAEESTHHLAALQLSEGDATGCQVAVFNN